ncbi:hypothetical protein LCGC14_1524620 [marine sediment metagenome]|uniref:SCP domain-containing protein n=1 Tax=marine sediment metagenome TaxID=412755 RepID=A0A0F9LYL6_9ZZZZ
MNKEIKSLLTKFILLVSVVAIAWIASSLGLTEDKLVAFGKNIKEGLNDDNLVAFSRNFTDFGDSSESYIRIFNEYRVENRLHPLMTDNSLNALASERCIEISQQGNFSHEGLKKYPLLGENIMMLATSFDSNYKLLEVWANSPEHNANMLNVKYTKTGFARNGKYAVQLFSF